jgi:hypothetical protein
MERPTIVVLGFKQTFEKNPKTGLMDRPVDWVTYAPVHAVQTTQITERVDKMRPPETGLNRDDEGKKLAFLRFRWEMIEKAYNAWKEGVEVPIDGTPLGAWAGINEAQANAFRTVGIKTVEGVRDLPEALIGKVPLPSVREIMKQARLFLDAREASSSASKMAENESRISSLEEQLAAAMALLEERAKEPEKRKPGRPRKEAAEAEAA